MNSIIQLLNNKKTLVLNGEDYDVANTLSSLRRETLTNLVSGYDILFIDEAQNIPHVGKSLKLLVDTNPDISVFMTGSASFDLRGKIGEPLTGRSRFFRLYPFSLSEISSNYMNALQKLPRPLIWFLSSGYSGSQ